MNPDVPQYPQNFVNQNPVYEGIPVATSDGQKPMVKMLSRMLKVKSRVKNRVVSAKKLKKDKYGIWHT